MKRFLLHLVNWTLGAVAGSLLGGYVGKLIAYLFRGFLQDEAYAEAHPKKYLLGAFGIVILTMAIAYIAVSKPLNWICSKIDDKIDKFADDKEWD